MSEEKEEEWAIRDEATGEYLIADRDNRYAIWGTGEPVRHATYALAAARDSYLKERPTARIVPAPPREMSDAECWEWLQEHYSSGKIPDLGLFAGHKDVNEQWCVSDFRRDACIAFGPTPCDAIRAARRKLRAGNDLG